MLASSNLPNVDSTRSNTAKLGLGRQIVYPAEIEMLKLPECQVPCYKGLDPCIRRDPGAVEPLTLKAKVLVSYGNPYWYRKGRFRIIMCVSLRASSCLLAIAALVSFLKACNDAIT